MSKRKKISNDIIRKLDKKYNCFANDEEMSEEDNYIHNDKGVKDIEE